MLTNLSLANHLTFRHCISLSAISVVKINVYQPLQDFEDADFATQCRQLWEYRQIEGTCYRFI
jgi:hypothetical protein